MRESDKVVLRELYKKLSKHSAYQLLPARLAAVVNQQEFSVKSRSENERFAYIADHIDLKGKTIFDIGGNTGFFSFESIERGARHVEYCEGNEIHARFVRLAAEMLGLEDTIKATNEYYDFTSEGSYHDVVFNLNVLHHVGDDYGDKGLTVGQAKKNMIKQLNNQARLCNIMVYQMGFNWQGNVSQPLFENGTKKEMIDYIRQGIRGYWDEIAIGIAQRHEEGIRYYDLNDTNIDRDDTLGEFLNRPIFIFKSLKVLDETT